MSIWDSSIQNTDRYQELWDRRPLTSDEDRIQQYVDEALSTLEGDNKTLTPLASNIIYYCYAASPMGSENTVLRISKIFSRRLKLPESFDPESEITNFLQLISSIENHIDKRTIETLISKSMWSLPTCDSIFPILLSSDSVDAVALKAFLEIFQDKFSAERERNKAAIRHKIFKLFQTASPNSEFDVELFKLLWNLLPTKHKERLLESGVHSIRPLLVNAVNTGNHLVLQAVIEQYRTSNLQTENWFTHPLEANKTFSNPRIFQMIVNFLSENPQFERDIQKKPEFLSEALVRAVQFGTIETLKGTFEYFRIIDDEGRIQIPNENKQYLLYCAAENNNIDVIKLVISFYETDDELIEAMEWLNGSPLKRVLHHKNLDAFNLLS